ncbi:hypothetical protein HUJ05_009789 [Dendroctonus ponderosae]|nr:hypothetical protein HUJ05_009789 [Dendroctonus ponderosae]
MLAHYDIFQVDLEYYALKLPPTFGTLENKSVLLVKNHIYAAGSYRKVLHNGSYLGYCLDKSLQVDNQNLDNLYWKDEEHCKHQRLCSAKPEETCYLNWPHCGLLPGLAGSETIVLHLVCSFISKQFTHLQIILSINTIFQIKPTKTFVALWETGADRNPKSSTTAYNTIDGRVEHKNTVNRVGMLRVGARKKTKLILNITEQDLKVDGISCIENLKTRFNKLAALDLIGLETYKNSTLVFKVHDPCDSPLFIPLLPLTTPIPPWDFGEDAGLSVIVC